MLSSSSDDEDDDGRLATAPRNLHKRQFFELENFYWRFRLTRVQSEQYWAKLGGWAPNWPRHDTNRRHTSRAKQKFLCALRLYACSSFLTILLAALTWFQSSLKVSRVAAVRRPARRPLHQRDDNDNPFLRTMNAQRQRNCRKKFYKRSYYLGQSILKKIC